MSPEQKSLVSKAIHNLKIYGDSDNISERKKLSKYLKCFSIENNSSYIYQQFEMRAFVTWPKINHVLPINIAALNHNSILVGFSSKCLNIEYGAVNIAAGINMKLATQIAHKK